MDDALRAQGVTAGTRLLKLNDINGDAGGPILRDRLWWFGSAREYTTFEQVIGFPKDFKSNLRNYSARTNYQLGKGNQLSGFWTYNRKFQPNRGAGTTQPNPLSTINQQSPKNLFNLNWTSVLSQARFLEISSTYFHMHWPSRFADEFFDLPEAERTPSMQNLTTGVFFDGPEPTGERLRDAYRYQTNIAFTQYLDGVLGASHQIKSGFENWYGWGSDGFDIYQRHAAAVPERREWRSPALADPRVQHAARSENAHAELRGLRPGSTQLPARVTESRAALFVL